MTSVSNKPLALISPTGFDLPFNKIGTANAMADERND